MIYVIRFQTTKQSHSCLFRCCFSFYQHSCRTNIGICFEKMKTLIRLHTKISQDKFILALRFVMSFTYFTFDNKTYRNDLIYLQIWSFKILINLQLMRAKTRSMTSAVLDPLFQIYLVYQISTIGILIYNQVFLSIIRYLLLLILSFTLNFPLVLKNLDSYSVKSFLCIGSRAQLNIIIPQYTNLCRIMYNFYIAKYRMLYTYIYIETE